MQGGEDTEDSRIWAEQNGRIGAQIVGRRMFDFGYEAWGDDPPFRASVFVVTNRPGDRIDRQGGTSCTFVTDGIAAAVDQAKVAAGNQDVLIAGGLSSPNRPSRPDWSTTWPCTSAPSSREAARASSTGPATSPCNGSTPQPPPLESLTCGTK
jgi:hypothetical protein